jgi:cell division protein FtsQ
VRQPAFAFREVVVTTPLERASGAHLEAVVREELRGTFFTLDLDAARARSRGAVGARRALRRQWPHRSRSTSTSTSRSRAGTTRARRHARRGFVADWNGELPQFNGPGRPVAAMTARYREWRGARAARADGARLRCRARGGWQHRRGGAAGR